MQAKRVELIETADHEIAFVIDSEMLEVLGLEGVVGEAIEVDVDAVQDPFSDTGLSMGLRLSKPTS